MSRGTKRVEKEDETPKSSKGMRIDNVKKVIATFSNKEQILEFTKGDKRAFVVQVVAAAIERLSDPEAKETPETPEEITPTPPPQDDEDDEDDDGEYRRFKLLRKGHRGPAQAGIRPVPGKKYVKGDIAKISADTPEKEIKRLFKEGIWLEIE